MKKLIFIFVLVLLIPTAVLAQGNAFSFQGRLNDGSNPANGAYDLQFRLFDAIAGGTQIGSLVSRPNTILINGVFSTTLDFGAAAFTNPSSIFIEIAVKPNGSPNAYTILGPRQQLTVVPYAVRSTNATNADNATNAQNAVNSQNAVNATNAQNSVNATNAQNSVNATNAQNSVNATNATNATTATTAATANNALSLGGVAPAGWARLNVQNTGDLLMTGRLQISGNATQFTTSNGLVKAMIVVRPSNNTIARCYNGITGSSSGNCGFSFTKPLFGVTRIDFGFDVSNRFISITPHYDNGSTNPIRRNNGANYRLFGNNSIEVFTFITNDAENTYDISEFNIIIF